MVKTRYVDKNILCEYDFKEEFINLLGIKINDVIPLRKVFVLFTDKGKKVLKITKPSLNPTLYSESLPLKYDALLLSLPKKSIKVGAISNKPKLDISKVICPKA